MSLLDFLRRAGDLTALLRRGPRFIRAGRARRYRKLSRHRTSSWLTRYRKICRRSTLGRGSASASSFVNLLQNAAEVVDLRKRGRVEVSRASEDKAASWTLTVADDGRGMSEEVRARIASRCTPTKLRAAREAASPSSMASSNATADASRSSSAPGRGRTTFSAIIIPFGYKPHSETITRDGRDCRPARRAEHAWGLKRRHDRSRASRDRRAHRGALLAP